MKTRGLVILSALSWLVPSSAFAVTAPGDTASAADDAAAADDASAPEATERSAEDADMDAGADTDAGPGAEAGAAPAPEDGVPRDLVEDEASAARTPPDPAAAAVSAGPPAEAETSAVPPPPTTPAAAEVADEEEPDPGEKLKPSKEKELMAKHPVDVDSAHFKPGTGLTFTSKDGRFELATRLRAQFLYALERDGESGDTLHGLTIRRARLQFKGHAFNEHNKFKTEFALSPRDMAFDGGPRRTPILDWYLDFDYLRDLTLRVGQYKLNYSRQRVISSGDLQLVDRSIANSEFTIDRDIGVELLSEDLAGLGKLRYHAGVFFGEGRDQFEPDRFEMLYVGRVEVLPFGMFQDYKEADFERSLKPRMSLGVGYAFHDGAKGLRGTRGPTPTDGGTTDYQNVNADLVFKIAGLSLSGDFFWRYGVRKFGDAEVDDGMGNLVAAPREAARNGLGWSGQAGFLIPRVPFELAYRYAQVRGMRTTSLTDEDSTGGGLSYYFAGHPLKLQLDYFHQWTQEIEKGDDIVRLQLQASF